MRERLALGSQPYKCIAEKDRQDSTRDAQYQVDQGGQCVAIGKQQDITEGQTAERGIGTEEAHVDE